MVGRGVGEWALERVEVTKASVVLDVEHHSRMSPLL